MSRRQTSVPQTPAHNDDARERSSRRQSSNRMGYSIADTARRVQESPLRREMRRGPDSSHLGILSDEHDIQLAAPDRQSQATQVDAAEFQEWMKMVRMKRVKANNAFTIQLIDAFHGMVRGDISSQDGEVLTQTADGVTFQEASHTLGGCVTVYRSRIARVKDDTSKSSEGFNGNAEERARNAVTQNGNANAGNEGDGDEYDDSEGDSDADDEEKSQKKKQKQKRRMQRSEMAFLSPPEKLEIDTNELATTIDPLLRKMAADFDKRGAEALLQYSSKLDNRGRLWLGSEADEPEPSDAANTEEARPEPEPEPEQRGRLSMIKEAADEALDELENRSTENGENGNEEAEDDYNNSNDKEDDSSGNNAYPEVDLAHFNVTYFSSLDFTNKETSPLVDSIARAVANPQEGTDKLIQDMQAWAIADPGNDNTYHIEDDVEHEEDEESNEEADAEEPAGLGLSIGPWDQEGGETPGIEFDDPANSFGADASNQSANESSNSMISNRMPVSGNWMDIENLQNLDAQKTNWAGPSFWKIRRLQARVIPENGRDGSATPGEDDAFAVKKKKRGLANLPTVIDFFDDDTAVDFESIVEPKAKQITLRDSQFTDDHIIPVDMHVSTRQLIASSLRPRTGIARAFRRGAWSAPRNRRGDTHDYSFGPTGEDYSNVENHTMDGEMSYGGVGGISGINHTFDPSNPIDDNFFHTGWEEDNISAPQATTAAELFSQNVPQSGYGANTGNQLNFSKVAKRVDVRRLKENVWHAIHTSTQKARPEEEREEPQPDAADPQSQSQSPSHPEEPAKHTLLQVIRDTQPLYTEQQRADLSPALYFISLLHLSNERGLTLKNMEALTDIEIIERNEQAAVVE